MKQVIKHRGLKYGVAVLALIVLANFFPLPDCLSLSSRFQQYGYQGEIYYTLVCAIALIFLIPRTPFIIFAGVAFGTVKGSSLNILASILAACVCFAIGKRAQTTTIEDWLLSQKWFKKMDRLAHTHGFSLVLATRMAHVIHFSASSYALGLVPIKFRDFFIGTLIGVLPGTLVTTYVGENIGCTALSGFHHLPPDMQTKLAVSFILMAIVGGLPLLLTSLFPKAFSHEKKRLHVQAHRGVCIELQENTLPAFQRAIEVGADSIELDVHVTKDNHIVVYHDFLLEPEFCTLNGKKITQPIPIHDLTYAELTQYDCLVSRRLRGENTLSAEQRKIPKLKDVFQLFKNSPLPHAKQMLIDIEVKSDPRKPNLSPPPKQFCRLLISEIKREWGFGRVAVRSFDPRITLTLIRKHKRIHVIQLTNGGFVDYPLIIRRLKPHTIAPNLGTIQKEHIDLIQRAGIEVMPWTANTPEEWKRLISLGVDGITTDDPKGLLNFLSSQVAPV